MFALALASFLAATAWCAWRLRVSGRVADIGIGATWLLASWACVMTARQMTAGTALATFLVADVAVLVLPMLAIFRLLGGFDPDPWATRPTVDEDDGGLRVLNVEGPAGPRPCGPRGGLARPVRRGRRPACRPGLRTSPRRIPRSRTPDHSST